MKADNQADASRMFDILYTRGFHVVKEESTGEVKEWDIMIDKGWFGSDAEISAAIQVLNDYGYPRREEPKTEAGGGGNFGMASESEERKRQLNALQIQVAEQLYMLPNVISARVIIAQPPNDPLSIEKVQPTAAVLIVVKEAEPGFNTETVQGIVSGAVPNLKPGNVNVALSKQTLRDISTAEFENQRRSRAIFTIGTGVLLLLVGALGTIWYVTKRRKRKNDVAPEQLTEGEESPDELPDAERAALNAGDEE